MQIRGRGNSSWEYPKKPYKIKFDSRTSLLGMAKAKDYVLLAEYNDKSLIRNYMAHFMTGFFRHWASVRNAVCEPLFERVISWGLFTN